MIVNSGFSSTVSPASPHTTLDNSRYIPNAQSRVDTSTSTRSSHVTPPHPTKHHDVCSTIAIRSKSPFKYNTRYPKHPTARPLHTACLDLKYMRYATKCKICTLERYSEHLSTIQTTRRDRTKDFTREPGHSVHIFKLDLPSQSRPSLYSSP